MRPPGNAGQRVLHDGSEFKREFKDLGHAYFAERAGGGSGLAYSDPEMAEIVLRNIKRGIKHSPEIKVGGLVWIS